MDIWIEQIVTQQAARISDIIVVTNDLYLRDFCNWKLRIQQQYKQLENSIHVVSDGSTNNDNRTGAIRAMEIGLDVISSSQKEEKGLDGVVVIAGDVLFDFSGRESGGADEKISAAWPWEISHSVWRNRSLSF